MKNINIRCSDKQALAFQKLAKKQGLTDFDSYLKITDTSLIQVHTHNPPTVYEDAGKWQENWEGRYRCGDCKEVYVAENNPPCEWGGFGLVCAFCDEHLQISQDACSAHENV